MRVKYRTCSHIKDDGVRCGSPALKKQMFCFYHFRLYDSPSLPGNDEYCMPLLDTPQSVHLMAVQLMRAYLLKNITERQFVNLNNSLRLVLAAQRRSSRPLPQEVSRELSPIMLDVLSIDPASYAAGDLTWDMDPETCDNVIVEDPLSPDIHFEATPEMLKLLRDAVRKNPGMQSPLKKEPQPETNTDREKAV